MGTSRLGQRDRAPRVNIPNRESAVIDIGGKHLTGVLGKLSLTGGSVSLSKSIHEGTLAEITVQTTSGSVVSAIQFVKSTGSGMQGFRFVHLDPQTRSRLDMALQQMRKQGLGEGPHSILQHCTSVARRVIQKAKDQIDGA